MSVQLSFIHPFPSTAESAQRGLDNIVSVEREISSAEFDRLVPCSSVLRKNQDGTDDWLFEANQFAKIMAPQAYRLYAPHSDGSCDPRDYLVAELLCFAQEPNALPEDGEKIWAKICWLWRDRDNYKSENLLKAALDKIKTITDSMSQYELLTSSVIGFIPVITLEGPAEVIKFDDSIMLESRLVCDYYYRYHLDFVIRGKGKKNDIKITGLDLGKLCTAECISMFSPDVTIMHYCASCNRWYHAECLTNLRTFGDTEEMVLCRGIELGMPLGDLELLKFAFLPIMRGGPYGPGGWGFEQLKARHLVAQQSVGDEWRQSVDSKALKRLGKLAGSEGVNVYQCQCGNRWV